jgi:hypothetical protein
MMANKIMSRPFTTREKVLLLIMLVLLIGALYYFCVVKNVIESQADNTEKLTEITLQTKAQEALATEYAKKKQELDSMGPSGDLPLVAPYDNVKNELEELNSILGAATTQTLSFDNPTLEGSTVRRVVKINYTTPNYDAAFGIIESLQEGSYRCLVQDVSMNGRLLADGTVESVSTSLTVTFYETTRGAASTGGLEDPNK